MHSSNMDLESCYLQWTDCHQAVVVAKGTMGGAISCIRHVVKTLIMGGSIRHVVMALWVECRSYQACSKGIMGRTTTSIRHVWGVHGGRQGDGYASCAHKHYSDKKQFLCKHFVFILMMLFNFFYSIKSS